MNMKRISIHKGSLFMRTPKETETPNLIKKQKSKEDGNFIDMMGSLFIMVFIFALILAFAAFGSMVRTRLAIDNNAKEYLYQMEQSGFLSSTLKDQFKNNLEGLGCTNVVIDATSDKVPYGSSIKLGYECEYPNPLYKYISEEKNGNAMGFGIIGISQTIHYKNTMTATALY